MPSAKAQRMVAEIEATNTSANGTISSVGCVDTRQPAATNGASSPGESRGCGRMTTFTEPASGASASSQPATSSSNEPYSNATFHRAANWLGGKATTTS